MPDLGDTGSSDRAVALVGRALGWGMLGGGCGLLCGLGVGVIQAPAAVPGDPLAHEGYTIGVILLMLVEGLAGFLAGAWIAVNLRRPKDRRDGFAHALGGALVGVGLGWVLTRVLGFVVVRWADGSELMASLALQAVGVGSGIVRSLILAGPAEKGP